MLSGAGVQRSETPTESKHLYRRTNATAAIRAPPGMAVATDRPWTTPTL